MSKAQKKMPAEAAGQSIKTLPKRTTKESVQKPFRPDTKQAKLFALLQRPTGTTADEMVKVTGWQRHSVLGMVFGVLKTRLGFTITSVKEKRGRIYRIVNDRA